MTGENVSYRSVILPVPAGVYRPRWSVMIPTYNAERFLAETIESVLSQDQGPDQMQIEVLDDCSTEGDPAHLVEEIGRGRVSFYKQPENVGHVRNFDACIQRSTGVLVHILHGDDYVRAGFYRKIQSAFDAHPEAGAAFCRYISVDENGHWQTIWPLEQPESGFIEGWLEKIAAGQRLQPPCMVVRREVYEKLGGFDRRITRYGEDWEMWVRIAANYPVWYEPEPLAVYRVRPASLSASSMRTGENIHDLLQVIAINRSSLPPGKAQRITRQARESCALTALRRAQRMLEGRHGNAPLIQATQAFACSLSFRVFFRAAIFFALWVKVKLQDALSAGRGG